MKAYRRTWTNLDGSIRSIEISVQELEDKSVSSCRVDTGQFLTDEEIEAEVEKPIASSDYDLKFQAMEQTIYDLQSKLFDIQDRERKAFEAAAYDYCGLSFRPEFKEVVEKAFNDYLATRGK